jgi:hypothetical protein
MSLEHRENAPAMHIEQIIMNIQSILQMQIKKYIYDDFTAEA